VVQRGRVRRARLNYLRKLQGKAARIKGERIQVSASEAVVPAVVAAPPAAPST